MNKIVLPLNPNVRIRLTLEREMTLDRNERIFNESLLNNYIARVHEVRARRDAGLKSVLLTDGFLALIINGKNISIPGLGIALNDVPVAQETLAIFAALSFLMLSYAFLNTQLYEAIVQVFAQKKTLPYGIDPDFLSAGLIQSELYIKAFSGKMNPFAEDFYKPNKAFTIYHQFLLFFSFAAMLGLVLVHFLISFIATWPSKEISTIPICLFAITLLFNVAAVMVTLGSSFKFDVWIPDAPSDPIEAPTIQSSQSSAPPCQNVEG